MKEFQVLLKYCTSRQLQIANEGLDPVTVADKVYQFCEAFGFFTPTQEELAGFLASWKAILLAAQPLNQKRVDAIELIEQCNAQEWVSLFGMVDSLEYMFQLALRVGRPEDIDQASIDFCGQAGLLYFLARNDPEHYVKFLLSLVKTGTGTLRQALIEPLPHVMAALTPVDMKEVDYVPMSSLRNALDVSHVPGVLPLAIQGTQPQVLVGILRKMGYTQVLDRINFQNALSKQKPRSFDYEDAMALSRLVKHIDTHGSMSPTTRTAFEAEDAGDRAKKVRLLEEVHTKLSQHHLVIVAIDASIISKLDKKPMKPSLTEDRSLHYVTVQQLDIAGNFVQLQLFSWGKLHAGRIQLFDLAVRFFGYISAQP